jgi:hypothetical protein
MGGWPRLRETRTIQAGAAPGAVTANTVIRCDISDLMLVELAVSVVFFFERELDVDRLADSLAAALRRLPAFAGRLHRNGAELKIVCDDSGVPLTVYEADETLPEAIGRMTLPDSGFVEHVDPKAAQLGEAPLLRIQVSRLADGATALGCAWHHAVGDMRSFMVLMQTWSALAQGTTPPEAEFAEDRDAYIERVLPAEDSGRPGFRMVGSEEMAVLDNAFAAAPRANRGVQLYFGAREVARMKERYAAAAQRRLSTNDALTAHLVSCVRRLDDDEGPRALTIPVDLRRFLGLSPSATGNLVGEIHLDCPPTGPAEGLAARIRAAVDDFPAAHLSLRTSRQLLAERGPALLDQCVPLGFDPPNKTFMTSNWSGSGVYDTIFEGCRPTAFAPAIAQPLPWVSWIVEGFEGRGFLCTLVVPAALAARLRGAAGAELLHRFREPGDESDLPALAGKVRKLG